MNNQFVCKCMSEQFESSFDLHKDLQKYYKNETKESVLQSGKEQKILPYIAHAMTDSGCDTDLWSKVHARYMQRNQKVLELLINVFEAFELNGLKNICVSENFASILSADACLGCFCSGDVDFYCYDIDLNILDSVMHDFGFEWDNRHTRKKSFAREYKSMTAIGEEFWLNFQWKPMTRKKSHLYDQRYIMKRYPSLFLETEFYADTKIKLFTPTVNIYLNCIHIASGHYYILTPGCRLYADIDRPVRNREIDWNRVNQWIKEDRLGMRADTVLTISRILLNTPIPEIAFSDSKKTKRFSKLINSLLDKDMNFKRPSGKIQYILFLIRVELESDGTNCLLAFLKRLYVILVGKD